MTKKMKINLNNRKFKSLSNSANGEISDTTIFHYYQRSEMIWAEYFGGEILKGFLIGKIFNRSLQFSYQHMNHSKEIMTGKCKTQISLNENGKIQLNEEWEWTCKDYSKGTSKLIEI